MTDERIQIELLWEKARKWSDSRCPDCGFLLATPELWQHDDGCECEKCEAVCWSESGCGERDEDTMALAFIAGWKAREEYGA